MASGYKDNPPPMRRGKTAAECLKTPVIPDPCFYIDKRRKASETDADCVPVRSRYSCPKPSSFKRFSPEIIVPEYTPTEIVVPPVPPIDPEDPILVGNPEVSVTCESLFGSGDLDRKYGSSITIPADKFFAETEAAALALAQQAAEDSLVCCFGNTPLTYDCPPSAAPDETYVLNYTDDEGVEHDISVYSSNYSGGDSTASYGRIILTPAPTAAIIDVDFAGNALIVQGQHTISTFPDNIVFVQNSSELNGGYTINSLIVDVPTNRTQITLNEELSSAEADGEILVGQNTYLDIVDVVVNNKIKISGDRRSNYNVGSFITIHNHWLNEGIFQVSSRSYASVTNVTTLTLNTDSIVDLKLQPRHSLDLLFGPIPSELLSTGQSSVLAGEIINCTSYAAAQEEAENFIESETLCEYKNRAMRRVCPPNYTVGTTFVEEGQFTIVEDIELTPKENQTIVDNLALQALMDIPCTYENIPCPLGYDFRGNIEVISGNAGGVGSISLTPDEDRCGAQLVGSITMPTIPCPTGSSFTNSVQFVNAPVDNGLTITKDDTCGFTLQGKVTMPTIPCPTGISFTDQVQFVNAPADNDLYIDDTDNCNPILKGKITLPTPPNLKIVAGGGRCCKWELLSGAPIDCPDPNVKLIAEYRCYEEWYNCNVSPNNDEYLISRTGNCISCWYQVLMTAGYLNINHDGGAKTEIYVVLPADSCSLQTLTGSEWTEALYLGNHSNCDPWCLHPVLP